MQNNTIAFTILKFPVLVRVQLNFTTVYSIFSFSTHFPKLGLDIVILLISFLLLPLLPCFNPLYFCVSCRIQTLASPWSNSIVPKIGVLFTGSLFSQPKSLGYITRCHIRWRFRQRALCVSGIFYMLTIAVTFSGGTQVNKVGSGGGGGWYVPTREAGPVGTGSSGSGAVWPAVHHRCVPCWGGQLEELLWAEGFCWLSGSPIATLRRPQWHSWPPGLPWSLE